MLEEQIRELEVRSDERLEDERKRSKEMLARLEREKQLEIENYAIRYEKHILLFFPCLKAPLSFQTPNPGEGVRVSRTRLSEPPRAD